MSRSSILFKAIDIICYPGQNYKRFPGLTVVKNISYGEHCYNKGDIYYDKKFEGKKYPVIMNIHGGGFSAGDKSCRKSLSGYYASKGFFVWNVNYRLGPKEVYPTQAIDAANALNKILEFKDEYNLDMDKIIVTGDSAGAYLATYLVALSANPELADKIGAPRIKVNLRALVSFCGVYDFEETLKHPIPLGMTKSIGQDFLGFKFNKDLSNYVEYPMLVEASPCNFVNEKWPSSFLIMSEKDVFCAGQGEALEAKLQELGVPVRTYKTQKVLDNHCFHLDLYRKQSKLCLAEVFKFLEEIVNE